MVRRFLFIAVAVGLGALLLSVCCVSAVNGQESMTKPPEFHVIVPSNYDFDDTLDLLKGSVESHNLMVVTEVNPQQMLRMVGVQTKGMRQIYFFHPRYMKSLLETNKHATIEPPLKFAVMEMPNGKVMIRYIKPSYLFGRYDDLEAFGVEMDELVTDILTAVQE